jgi:hypothetical protein
MVVGEASIHNIMGGMESTGGVRLHNHKRKLKQRYVDLQINSNRFMKDSHNSLFCLQRFYAVSRRRKEEFNCSQ